MKCCLAILLLLLSSSLVASRVSADELQAAHLSQEQSPISTTVSASSSNPTKALDQVPHQPELLGALNDRVKWVVDGAKEHGNLISGIFSAIAVALSLLNFFTSRHSNAISRRANEIAKKSNAISDSANQKAQQVGERIAMVEEENLKIRRDDEQRIYRDNLAEVFRLNTQWEIAMNKLDIALLGARGLHAEMPQKLVSTMLMESVEKIDASVMGFAEVKEHQKTFFKENEKALKQARDLEKIDFRMHKELQSLGVKYKKAADVINSGANDIEQLIALLRKQAQVS